MQKITDYLRTVSYPGRGIVLAKDAQYYFIMGRSQNSRNRVFVETEDGIRTEAYRPELVEDPSLIIYHPVRRVDGAWVITNGDQTDTIVEQGNFYSACDSRCYEPDAPNFTPRISAFVEDSGKLTLSILKKGAGQSCIRQYFAYEELEEGTCLFISTYEGDGDPLPSFKGEPKQFVAASATEIWEALDADNKISLWAREAGKVQIFNKHLGD